MTEEEILTLELVAMHIGQVDTSFQFWLTITFGVLVAIHIVGSAITRQLKLLLCFLYVSATLIFVFHTIGDLIQATIYNELVGKESPASLWNELGSLLRMLVYFLGTVSVSITIFRYDTWLKKSNN